MKVLSEILVEQHLKLAKSQPTQEGASKISNDNNILKKMWFDEDVQKAPLSSFIFSRFSIGAIFVESKIPNYDTHVRSFLRVLFGQARSCLYHVIKLLAITHEC